MTLQETSKTSLRAGVNGRAERLLAALGAASSASSRLAMCVCVYVYVCVCVCVWGGGGRDPFPWAYCTSHHIAVGLGTCPPFYRSLSDPLGPKHQKSKSVESLLGGPGRGWKNFRESGVEKFSRVFRDFQALRGWSRLNLICPRTKAL